MENKKTLIVIVGPTASGKTALSVKIAKLFNTEIISADSRQFYKEMNIGTAKPTIKEMDGVVHHFINSHSITEEYSIGKYEKEAMVVLENIFQAHDVAVLVGGSGLYVKVVCEGMDEIPDTDPEIRAVLADKLNKEGLIVLLEELKKVDPIYYDQVDRSNTQRVVRALEVFQSTGVPYSDFRKGEKKERPFNIIKIGLLWDRTELYNRIDQRMDVMIQEGLFEEAKNLYPYKNSNALQTVGYKEIYDYLDGHYDKEEAVRLLKRNSRRYAKRQITWFNKDKEITWFDPNIQIDIINYLESII
jgi:tRNA dimethylallyltransferase